ncbi:uncharacterized protein C1orf21 homolog [Stigmatopora argus]
MGCASAKQVSDPAAPDGEEERSKSHGNGDLISDEYRANGAEKYAGAQEAATDGYVTEKSALLGQSGRFDDTGSNEDGKILSVHSSESQQEFFRMLDEKIEKGRDYYSEEEDAT